CPGGCPCSGRDVHAGRRQSDLSGVAPEGAQRLPSGRTPSLDGGSGRMSAAMNQRGGPARPISEPDANLVIRSVSKSFGGITALSECSLEVKAGSITALIGPNGSGKTTLFNCVTGFYRPDQGEMRFGETVLTGLRPNQIVHLGIARTFQITRIFK